MPEGPEVKTIVDGLEKELTRANLKQIIFSDTGKYRDKVPVNFRQLEESLPIKIKDVKCKGKFIYFSFDNDFYIGNSLGMTGFWRMSDDNDKHLCMTLVTSRGNFQFIDQRHFGCVHIFVSKEELDKKLKTIGPDFLNTHISEKEFLSLYKSKPRKNIVMALMDQKLVSGIGNYIKSEVLYRARISPHRNISSLSSEELEKLYRSIEKVTKSSYKHKGMSQENYVTLDGEEGEFIDYLQVYRKKTDPKGNPVKREETKDKRTTFWVPALQV
jgi:DNA-formamidopyrimidine glycosylase